MEIERFLQDVSSLAKHPGRLLANASYTQDGGRTILWIIEGPEPGGLTIKGMTTDFGGARLFRLHITGLGILDDLPRLAREDTFSLSLGFTDPANHGKHASGAFVPKSAQVITTVQRGPNGIDPDGAFVKFLDASGKELDATITNYREGCWLLVVVVGIGLVALAGCSTPERPPDVVKRDLDVTVNAKIPVVDLGVEAHVGLHEEWHNPPAPITSGTAPIGSGVAPVGSGSSSGHP